MRAVEIFFWQAEFFSINFFPTSFRKSERYAAILAFWENTLPQKKKTTVFGCYFYGLSKRKINDKL